MSNKRKKKNVWKKLFDDVHNSQVLGYRRAKKESAKRKEESLDTTAGRMIWAKSSSHRELQCICCTLKKHFHASQQWKETAEIYMGNNKKKVQQQQKCAQPKMLGCRAFHASFIHSYVLPTARAFNFYFIFLSTFFIWLALFSALGRCQCREWMHTKPSLLPLQTHFHSVF